MKNFYATVFSGLENSLLKELKNCSVENIEKKSGVIFFETNYDNACELNLKSRIANKIIYIIEKVNLNKDDYEKIYFTSLNIKWDNFFEINQTFKINVSSTQKNISNSLYAALKFKDGISDYFTKKYSRRPNVDKNNPDVVVELRIFNNILIVGLNMSGESLYKRNYRTFTNAAPLKETLAAGIADIILSTANNLKYKNIIDVMCGSGTLIIETAFKLLNKNHFLKRTNFGFQNLKIPYTLPEDELFKPEKDSDYSFLALDNSDSFIETAKKNIENAGLNKYIRCLKNDFFNSQINLENSLILFNPPYGKRLKGAKNINDFYKKIGDTIKNKCKNSTVCIFTENNNNVKSLKISFKNNIILFNGKIECALIIL